MLSGEVEAIHCADRIETGIRIEAIDNADAVVLQIALEFEIDVEAEGELFPDGLLPNLRCSEGSER
jgi:hypothetical protein